MRPLIQYDLDEPPTAPGPSASGALPPAEPELDASALRPTKKRRRGQPPGAAYKAKVPVQHWDDPGSAAVGVVYDEEPSVAMSYEEQGPGHSGGHEGAQPEEEESRALTHEEIWDDSALVDAWNSAEAEYEAYHGTSKAWKTEPVKRSPLWYNKPYVAPPQPGSSKPQTQNGDTAPLDFDTYVPTHDPSLASVSAPAPSFVPPPSTTTVSRDEAFNNALSAMYWSGYWTAVYHCQSQTDEKHHDEPAEDGVEVDDNEDQDLVPTQR